MKSVLSLSHFTEEEAEAQRGDNQDVTGLRSLWVRGRVEVRALQAGLGVYAAHIGHQDAGQTSSPPDWGPLHPTQIHGGHPISFRWGGSLEPPWPSVCCLEEKLRPRAGKTCPGAGALAGPARGHVPSARDCPAEGVPDPSWGAVSARARTAWVLPRL